MRNRLIEIFKENQQQIYDEMAIGASMYGVMADQIIKELEACPVDAIVKQATDIRDRNGRMIFFGDTVRFVDKVEWYRGAYWAKVARGVMTREEALKEIEEKPYEERIVEDVQDYDWLLKSEIQTYWEVVDA